MKIVPVHIHEKKALFQLSRSFSVELCKSKKKEKNSYTKKSSKREKPPKNIKNITRKKPLNSPQRL